MGTNIACGEARRLRLVFRHSKVLCVFESLSHVLEPRYWGVAENLVPLGALLNREKLIAHTKTVMDVTDTYLQLQKNSCRFLAAAASLKEDSAEMVQACMDAGKVLRCAHRIAQKELLSACAGKGREQRRFLSAMTPDGLLVFYETLQALCPKIYSLEDDYGVVSNLLLQEIRKQALERGVDVISCYCTLAPYDRLEHLMLPALGLGFTTSNAWHRADFPVYRRIHAARFTDAERLRLRRQRLSFNRRATRELLNEAADVTHKALEAYRQLETINSEAIDWQQAQRLMETVVEDLAALT